MAPPMAVAAPATAVAASAAVVAFSDFSVPLPAVPSEVDGASGTFSSSSFSTAAFSLTSPGTALASGGASTFFWLSVTVAGTLASRGAPAASWAVVESGAALETAAAPAPVAPTIGKPDSGMVFWETGGISGIPGMASLFS